MLIGFSALLAKYVEFLDKFVSQRVISHLVQTQVVAERNLALDQEIDNLKGSHQLPEGHEALKEWRPRWEELRVAQHAAFTAISRSQLKEDLPREDTHAQTEALALLMSEFNKMKSAENRHAEIMALESAFTESTKFSGTGTPTIATWLLPPYEVESKRLTAS